jgi:hypothetical protein
VPGSAAPARTAAPRNRRREIARFVVILKIPVEIASSKACFQTPTLGDPRTSPTRFDFEGTS